MKKIYSFILLFAITVACKKESNPSTSTSSGSGGTLPLSTANYPNDADAVLVMNNAMDYFHGVNYPQTYNAQAWFYETTGLESSRRQVGPLSFCSQSLWYDSLANHAYQSNNLVWPGNGMQTWIATDTGSFGNFNASFNYNLLPISSLNLSATDTIYKSQGFTFNHPNLHADSVSYYLLSANGNSVIKKKNGNSTSVSFTATELNSLDTSLWGAFNVIWHSLSADSLNNKKIYFNNNSSILCAPKIQP